jgi:hypothetical protein
MAGLAIYKRGVHSCGFHLSLTKDRANHFAIEEDECLVCASMERFDRIRGEADRKVLDRMGGDKAPAALGRPSDGRVTFVKQKPSPAVEALLNAAQSDEGFATNP